MQEKQCRDCGEIKPISEFYRHHASRDGFRHQCKECNPEHSFVDEMGNRHGRLTIVKRIRNNRHGEAQWLCKCDCGNEITAWGINLRRKRGGVKSCGCLQKEGLSKRSRLPQGVAAFNAYLSQKKRDAEKRKLEWALSSEQVQHLSKQPCFYCGALPLQATRRHYSTGTYLHNGLDRQDNNKGYIMGNVVACCKTCNWAKKDMTIDDFYNWIAEAYNHLRLGEHKK